MRIFTLTNYYANHNYQDMFYIGLHKVFFFKINLILFNA